MATSTNNIIIVEKQRRSKMFLLLIQSFGAGYFGLDRMYMGCWFSGLLRLLLLLCGISLFVLFPISSATPIDDPNRMLSYLGVLLITMNVLWTLFDIMVSTHNAIVGDLRVPYTYCKNSYWQDSIDIIFARLLGALVFLFNTGGVITLAIKVIEGIQS